MCHLVVRMDQWKISLNYTQPRNVHTYSKNERCYKITNKSKQFWIYFLRVLSSLFIFHFVFFSLYYTYMYVAKLLSKSRSAKTLFISRKHFIQKHFHFCIDFFWLAQSRLETTKTLSFLKFCGMNGFCVFIAYSY